ncbi:4-carboxymuconolactone decarboxylase [Rhodococcus rhodochrous]|jgi:4-carboxymuconolactone decarboxylase|uniref:carboxymuconolactone decarboxylase family protein n=1 Tax=Rhodococcus rhodochrous TaxID=1829 RepID=UPI0007510D7F|nr:carboxymuconolactone decarboxylase family protein [Rhodococcus rhodochrous]MCR8692591.1 carboxymuconolactone decarboxylase family protein [Rhodococcus pyridinivorans]AYA25174.1 carboxymuconolactone decarboxylase family protein [Rhodococcus rhodochrous]MCB8909564.1 carboxymuconolactone decarboxylase family protein [Rhodococcus rhodochrous]MCD2098230.1 carboxymuconolactone decarboxylase family protein [Rhodococcus rhodochrous]MCD2122501.1 carboxymuconolactone decarboxylase family protein [Rho
MTDETRRRGLEMMSKVYGWEMQDGPGEHFAVTADHLFANIWTRPGLSIRDRRLLLLGALTAQGAPDIAEIQIEAALKNDELDEQQLREIALFLCHYVGWPLGSKLDNAVGSVLQRRKAAARS